MTPLALLARRFGVITRYAEIGDGASGVVEALESQITSRTRIIALSHVLWSTGAVLPLIEISGLARRHELIVVVDGAQSAGQVPVDLHAMGIDAYAMAGQKWLCGPEATGLLYVRKDRFADIAPTYVRYGQFDPSGYFIPAEGAKRYEVGEFYSPAVAAQETALRWLRDDVGFAWAHDRIAALGADFRNRLTSIDGVTVITPRQPMAGLVNFNIAGLRPQDVTSQLFERGYTIRYVETAPCSVSARVSVGWWNTEEEVGELGRRHRRSRAGSTCREWLNRDITPQSVGPRGIAAPSASRSTSMVGTGKPTTGRETICTGSLRPPTTQGVPSAFSRCSPTGTLARPSAGLVERRSTTQSMSGPRPRRAMRLRFIRGTIARITR